VNAATIVSAELNGPDLPLLQKRALSCRRVTLTLSVVRRRCRHVVIALKAKRLPTAVRPATVGERPKLSVTTSKLSHGVDRPSSLIFYPGSVVFVSGDSVLDRGSFSPESLGPTLSAVS
jgi:hypothetical protein